MNKFYAFFMAMICFIMSNHLSAQTILLDDNNSLSGFPFNGKIVLLSDRDSTFWTSNGTPGGTSRISTTSVDDGGAGILNNMIYFAGISESIGSELWRTDGTTGGTALVTDIVAGPASSKPEDFFTFNNKIYFTAFTTSNGRELYEYTGSGSPIRVTDLNPGAGNSFEDPEYYFNNNTIYFNAVNGTGKAFYALKTSGISKLMDFPPGFNTPNFFMYTNVGNTVYFFLTNGSHLNLYKTDGTTSGTGLVRAFTGLYSSKAFQMISFKNKLFFAVADDGLNSELWSTDGTTTQMVKDINPGENGSNPMVFNSVILNNKLIFMASTDDSGYELWSTDGTETGTTLVKNINTEEGEGSNPILYPVLRNFDYADLTYRGLDVYDRSANFNGFIFLEVENGTDNIQLWKTDGTTVGTTLVKTLNTTGDGLSSSYMYTKNGLVFGGNDGISGTQPWVSDGTGAGTQLISIINPSGDADPEFEFMWKGDIYLVADNGNGGAAFYTDFYKLQGPYSSLPVSLIHFSAVAGNSNVQLTWSTASENNSEYFKVERSTDGISFISIGKVQAAGLSSTLRNYRYTDENAYSQGVPQLYYRLQTIDKDGKSAFSKVEPVLLNSLPVTLKIYPNPAHELLEVQYCSTVKSTISIIDLNGKSHYLSGVEASTNGIHKVNISNFPAGLFFVKMVSEGTVTTQKLVIK